MDRELKQLIYNKINKKRQIVKNWFPKKGIKRKNNKKRKSHKE